MTSIPTAETPQEACGVVGIFSENSKINIAPFCYLGLYALQHRGQASAGMVTSDGNTLWQKKGLGLVPDVFGKDEIEELPGYGAIGHVRLATDKDRHAVNTQPLAVRSAFGSLAIAHNGRLTNRNTLEAGLLQSGAMLQTDTDSEIILNLIAKSEETNLPKAVAKTLRLLEGAYALVILSQDMILAARDPVGNRPLCLGKMETDPEAFIVASESCAVSNLGGKLIREVEPGELLVLDKRGYSSHSLLPSPKKAFCAFEHIYFARPDSILSDKNAYLVRKAIGKELALESKVNADIVIGAPDSGISPALGFAEASGLPFETGVIKNRYVGRVFLEPNQARRDLAVRIKLNPIAEVLNGKRVAVIDDSIVRGTTSAQLITLLKDAGAKEVHLYIASPPYRYACFYGVEPSNQSELVARGRTVEELRTLIGADSLQYVSVDGLVRALAIAKEDLCLACFTGEYPISSNPNGD
ncbi:MAG: amidophosphoribosyltransferase [Firmicutes bacterium]|nr:amidophosphoribosyltransferase [Bacillota bacterium]